MAGAGPVLSSSDEIVIKSPNDRRLYRLLHLRNNLSALLIHDPEIYSNDKHREGDEEEDEEDEDYEDDEDDEDDDEDDEEDEEDEEDEGDEQEDGNKRDSSSHTKKVSILFCYFFLFSFDKLEM